MSSLRLLHCAETIKGGIATYLRDLLPLQRAAYGADAIVVIIPQSQIAELQVPTQPPWQEQSFTCHERVPRK